MDLRTKLVFALVFVSLGSMLLLATLSYGPARDLWRQSALETLDALLEDGHAGTFDFAFIDADKTNYDNYYERCLGLVRMGGVIAVDNVLWSGDVVNADSEDEDTRAIRAFNEKLHDDRRIDLSLVPIADGLTLARKTG